MKKAAFIIFIAIAAYIGIPFGLGLWNQSIGIQGFVKLAPQSSFDSADTENTDCPETTGIEVFPETPQTLEGENNAQASAPDETICGSELPRDSESPEPEADSISMPDSEETAAAPFETEIPADSSTGGPSPEVLPPEDIPGAETPDTEIPTDGSTNEPSPEVLSPEDIPGAETPHTEIPTDGSAEESSPETSPPEDIPGTGTPEEESASPSESEISEPAPGQTAAEEQTQ